MLHLLLLVPPPACQWLTRSRVEADTWVRWFTNDATGMILLLVSARYFSAQYSHFLIPGTALIYIASLAYMKYAPIKDHGASPADYRTHEFPSPTESKKVRKKERVRLRRTDGRTGVFKDPPRLTH